MHYIEPGQIEYFVSIVCVSFELVCIAMPKENFFSLNTFFKGEWDSRIQFVCFGLQFSWGGTL